MHSYGVKNNMKVKYNTSNPVALLILHLKFIIAHINIILAGFTYIELSDIFTKIYKSPEYYYFLNSALLTLTIYYFIYSLQTSQI